MISIPFDIIYFSMYSISYTVHLLSFEYSLAGTIIYFLIEIVCMSISFRFELDRCFISIIFIFLNILVFSCSI